MVPVLYRARSERVKNIYEIGHALRKLKMDVKVRERENLKKEKVK